jgi:glycosyltransferase involved in cell wall biosynthesis
VTDAAAPDTPLVSVGIPTYNRPEGARRTLNAIAGQTYQNLEIIVSDNASPDRRTEQAVGDIVARDARVRFHCQATNLGPSGNFQFVLSQATGRYFMWAADDDDWDVRFVERCVAGFDRPDVVSVMSRFRTLYRANGRVEEPPIPRLDPARSKAYNLSAFLRTPMPTLLYAVHRRDYLDFFRTETRWFDFYDCYFSLRLLTVGKIRIVPEVLYTAGVDSANYVVKRVAGNRWVRLTYLPFLLAGRASISASDLSWIEKAAAIGTLGLTVARLFFNHEIRNRR